MITVTETAKQLLKEILLDKTDDPEVSLRLSSGSFGKLGLVLSREDTDDQVVDYEGAKVLLIAPEVNGVLGEATLDVQDGEEGNRFVISA